MKHPIVFFILTDIVAFGLLFMYREPLDPRILVACGIVLLLTLLVYFAIKYLHCGDEYLILITSMLVTLGIAMLYRIDYDIGVKQIGWFVIGIGVFAISYILFRYVGLWSGMGWLYLISSIGLFVLTQLIGTSSGGSKNWIYIGSHSFQPSEFIKILFVLFLANYFGRVTDKSPKEKYVIMFCTFIFCGFLILQREWGSMVLLFAIYFFLLYIFRNDWKLLIFNAMLAIAVSVLGYMVLHHIQIRVETWLNPWSDASGAGYQITQSLYAISAGDFFGTGIGLGLPKLIPEVTSDFIFAAICEELGIFGGAAVILLFFILVYRGFKISLTLTGFDKVVAVGLTLMLGLQTFIIIGGVIKFIPLTGITLPFISYGGSSLISSFAAVGILQAVSAKGGQSNEH